jgi:hypothetical protein
MDYWRPAASRTATAPNNRVTILWHTGRMPPDEDQLSLRQADQIRGDLYGIQDDLDFIKVQLARLPTKNEVWRAAMLGITGGAVTLIEAFARSGL